MKRKILWMMGTALVLGGCGGGSQELMQRPNSTTLFTTLVKQVLAASADTAVPTAVANLNISFADDENPQAFADVLPPTT